MAQKTEVILTDDLDGSPAEDTFRVSWEGQAVEVELSSDNRKRIEESLAALFDAGRRIPVHYGSRGPQGPKPKTKAPRTDGGAARQDNNVIRGWARQNGLQVSDRGRISREVLAEYSRLNPQG